MAEPLIVADDLRLDSDGVPACDGLGFETRGERVLVLGAPRVLFEAVSGMSSPVRGRLAVRGAKAAGAASEPPLPPGWTVHEYVVWSARLGGLSQGEAQVRATAAIEKLYLQALAKTKIGLLPVHARRATLAASALATSAAVIALDDPFGGLADDVAAAYATLLADALADRAWVVFAPRIPLVSPLAQAADEVIVASATRVDAQGAPMEIAASTRRFVVRLAGDAASVRAAVTTLGGRGGTFVEAGAHVHVELGPEMTATDLVTTCYEAGVTVVELAPIARAFS